MDYEIENIQGIKSFLYFNFWTNGLKMKPIFLTFNEDFQHKNSSRSDQHDCSLKRVSCLCFEIFQFWWAYVKKNRRRIKFSNLAQSTLMITFGETIQMVRENQPLKICLQLCRKLEQAQLPKLRFETIYQLLSSEGENNEIIVIICDGSLFNHMYKGRILENPRILLVTTIQDHVIAEEIIHIHFQDPNTLEELTKALEVLTLPTKLMRISGKGCDQLRYYDSDHGFSNLLKSELKFQLKTGGDIKFTSSLFQIYGQRIQKKTMNIL